MSEEEKKAIKIIEETHDMLVNPKLREEKYTTDDFEKAFYVVIMLIRKQQKEIEEKNIAINKMSKDISRQLEEIDWLKKHAEILYGVIDELKEDYGDHIPRID